LYATSELPAKSAQMPATAEIPIKIAGSAFHIVVQIATKSNCLLHYRFKNFIKLATHILRYPDDRQTHKGKVSE